VEAAPRKAESRPTDQERRPPAAPEDTSIAAPDEQDTVERVEELEQQLWDEEHAAEPWPWGWPDDKDWP